MAVLVVGRLWRLPLAPFGAGASRYLGDEGATAAGDDGGGTTLFDAYRKLACVALSSLALPVIISTAGAFETQAFALTYFLGAALLADEIVARVKRPSPKG